MSDFQKEYTDKITASLILPFIPKSITPNQISWFRIFSSPVILVLLLNELYVVGGIIFIISALSDAADGARARIENKITDSGKILDPIGDRSLIGVVSVVLIPKFFGWPLFVVLLGLELFQSIRAHFIKEKLRKNIDANWAGKVKMIIQAIALTLLFIGIFIESRIIISVSGYLIGLSVVFLAIEPFVYKELKEF